MSQIRTRRTIAQVKFFIESWLNSDSTSEVTNLLRRSRKDWPYSVESSSISQFASMLRSKGAELPHMDNRGHVIDVEELNMFIACH